MNLSPAEETIIEILRGEIEVDFTFTATRTEPDWSVTFASASDGVLVGRGSSFRQALRNAFGITRTGPGVEEPTVTRMPFKVVGGTDAAPVGLAPIDTLEPLSLRVAACR